MLDSSFIVDPHAFALFVEKDRAVYESHSKSSLDRAELRYLALRAVGLERHGFTDDEQIPGFRGYWIGGMPLTLECADRNHDQRIAELNMSPNGIATFLQSRRDHDVQDLPRWKAFHALLVAAESVFGVGETFDMAAFTRGGEACYQWHAEETYATTSLGRTFVHPKAAAQWLLAHEPGMDGMVMHDSCLLCPDTHRRISVNKKGTGIWAQSVLQRIEALDLTLVLRAENLNMADRPRPPRL